VKNALVWFMTGQQSGPFYEDRLLALARDIEFSGRELIRQPQHMIHSRSLLLIVPIAVLLSLPVSAAAQHKKRMPAA